MVARIGPALLLSMGVFGAATSLRSAALSTSNFTNAAFDDDGSGITTDISPNETPAIDTARSSYTLSELMAGEVLPEFAGGTLTLNTSASIAKDFVINPQGGTIDLAGSSALFANNHISGPGGLFLTDSTHTSNADPGGTITLSEVTTYQGGTKIDQGVIVKLSTSGAVKGALPSASLTINGKFLLNGIAQTLSTLSGTDPTAVVDMGLSTGGLTINGPGSSSYAGQLIGSSLSGLTLSGTVALTLTSAPAYTGPTNLGGGTTLNLSGGQTSTLSFIFGPGNFVVDAGSTVTTSFVSNVGVWSIKGTHIIRPNNNTNSALISRGMFVPQIAGTGSTFTGKLDLNNNPLIIDATGNADKAAKISALLAALKAGENGGSWTGNGITSSTAAADAQHLAVALFDNATLGRTNVGGQLVDANSIIVLLMHRGDINGDGVIDIQDQGRVSNAWQKTKTGWAAGDLSGDGVVDIQDLSVVTNNWQQISIYKIPGTGFALSPVPEPGTAALLTAGALALLPHRKGSRASMSGEDREARLYRTP